MLIPLPGRVRRWLSHNDARPIFAGLFLPIWWDARLQPPPVPAYEDDDQPALMQMVAPPVNSCTASADGDVWTGEHGEEASPTHADDETTSFMQQGTPTLSDQPSESAFLVAHTFHMSTQYKLIQLELNPDRTMVEQLTPIWKPPLSEAIVALHEVVDPPFELQSTAEGTLLVEMTQDYVRKASVNDVMILADIQISDPGSRMQGIKLRKTLWARDAMTRAQSQVLQMFSADSLCNEGAIDCTLWRNKVMWPHTDTAVRQLDNGDFVHLLIRSLNLYTVQDVYRSLCQLETATSQRYIYHRSPSSEGGTPVGDAEVTEHVSDYTSDEEPRDRSRSRGRSLSLLQHGARLTSSLPAPVEAHMNVSFIQT